VGCAVEDQEHQRPQEIQGDSMLQKQKKCFLLVRNQVTGKFSERMLTIMFNVGVDVVLTSFDSFEAVAAEIVVKVLAMRIAMVEDPFFESVCKVIKSQPARSVSNPVGNNHNQVTASSRLQEESPQ